MFGATWALAGGKKQEPVAVFDKQSYLVANDEGKADLLWNWFAKHYIFLEYTQGLTSSFIHVPIGPI